MAKVIGVVGLGYVGLPVAVEFARKFSTVGFDINPTRVAELSVGNDRNREHDEASLRQKSLIFTSDLEKLKTADFFIVAVPTPIDEAKQPDLRPILSASKTVAQALKKGDTVVYESTVYPGVTEDKCVPILESGSGLKCGIDFKVGYSPERINPGDTEHTFTKIKKIVSGQDAETLEEVASVYGSVVTAGVFRARSIKVAEAAKVIENTQRDLNIALMNELAIIFDKMGIRTQDVLEAAGTKWNFLKFSPGLVGGHCIGVDPYYLTHKAEMLSYLPQVILAGRRINDEMGKYIAQKTIKEMTHCGQSISNSRVLILGLTFKENCRDIRNTRVVDIYRELQEYGVKVDICDPFADPQEAQKEYGIQLVPFNDLPRSAAVIVAVAHEPFRSLNPIDFKRFMTENSLLVDVKGIFPEGPFAKEGIRFWQL